MSEGVYNTGRTDRIARPPGAASGAVRAAKTIRRLYMSEVVSSSDFQSKVLDAQGPVLVDFFATWCGPCKMLAPTIDEIAGEQAGKATVYKLSLIHI